MLSLLFVLSFLSSLAWAPGGGGGGAAASLNPQNQNLKDTDFVDIMMWKTVCDFPFSRNQPTKSVDE
jgi:hypothetical protein